MPKLPICKILLRLGNLKPGHKWLFRWFFEPKLFKLNCAPGPGSIKKLSKRLETEPSLIAEAEAALRVGVHWETQARPPHEHRVCQGWIHLSS